MGVVDQKLDELALGKRLEMGAGVIQRRRGVAVFTKAGEGNRHAVLAEGALVPNRARAGEAKLLALGAKLDQVALRALDSGANPPGACPQRTHPTRFEIGKTAVVGARRREIGGDGGVEHLRELV
jgi:hypothetical protein